MTRVPSPFDVVTVTLNPAIDRTVTIPNFKSGAVNRAREVRNTAGGKGVNVASALADDSHQITVTGFLGRENAALFESLFAEKAIADRFVRIAGETRVGIKIVDPATNQTTDINFPGTTPTPHEIATLHEQLERMQAPWFVIGGSLPPGVAPTFYRDLVTALKARGIKVALDTSEEPLRLALEAAPTFIKPNIHELEALLGEPLRNEDAVITAARSLVARGIQLVVVSMGKDGACFVTADQVVIARPPDVKVHSTVGAGDAMVAGVVSAQIRGLSLEECARLGTAFSIEALTRTEGNRSSLAAIAAAMRQVTLH